MILVSGGVYIKLQLVTGGESIIILLDDALRETILEALCTHLGECLAMKGLLIIISETD